MMNRSGILKTIRGVMLCIVLSIFTVHSGWCGTYYVAKDQYNASDGNPGTESYPWETIQHAVDQALPGDTVYVKEGVYQERVQLTGTTGTEGKSGNSSDGYITYSGYPGHNVVLDGSAFYDWGCGFVSGVWAAGSRSINYVAIKNFTIRHYPELGIDFRADSENSETGVGSHHVIIQNVVSHNNLKDGIFISGGSEKVGGTTHDFKILGCVAYQNGYHGIKINGDTPGVTDRLHVHDVLIENCVSYENGLTGYDGIGIQVSTGNFGVTVRNNTCYRNGRQGICGNEIWDSTFDGNITYDNGIYSGTENDGVSVYNSYNVTIRKNTTNENLGYGIWVSGPGSFTHPVYLNKASRNVQGQIYVGGMPYKQPKVVLSPQPWLELLLSPS